MKNIKKLTSRRTSQNLKNTNPGHPNLNFKIIVEPFWHQFSLHFTTSRKLIFCNRYNAKCLFVFAFQALPFLHRKSIQACCFFKTPSWTSFFEIVCRFYAKMIHLGTASKSSGRQNWTQNRPSGTKNMIC